MRPFCSLLFVLVVGCGGSPPPAPVPPPAQPVAAKPVIQAPAPSDAVRRRDLVKLLDAGFGRFLQQVAVEPNLESGRFRGWTIVGLSPAEFWQHVDLHPGDVVRSVNGLPIEREMEAWEAFESLRTADEIRVTYQRAGTERAVRYRIVD